MFRVRMSVLVGIGLVVGLGASGSPAPEEGGAARRSGVAGGGAEERLDVEVAREAFGRSGALRVVYGLPGEPVGMPLRWRSERPSRVWYRWVPVRGTPGTPTPRTLLEEGEGPAAPAGAGVYELELSGERAEMRIGAIRLVVKVPFDRKAEGVLNGYHIGRYPTEGSGRRDRYAPPAGFVEVRQRGTDLRLSEHFRMGEFLTHDQKEVWPKYVIVERRLLDKLELVLDDLNERGIRADRMVVMSGYRTPQYNRRGLNRGRARLSRHQFGDAVDAWVDNDDDWYMDDLNGDGRRDTRDARVVLESVNRVEARNPDLVGGASVYPDNGSHGPFIHIDARGYRARW